MMIVSVLVGLLIIIGQTDEVKQYKQYSNDLNVYKLVSVQCEGGIHDSGYSIPLNQKLYLKEVNRDGTIGKICLNRK